MRSAEGHHDGAEGYEGDAGAAEEADPLAEEEDGDDGGHDDAELVDGGHLGNLAVLEGEEVKEPRGRPGHAAEGDEGYRLTVGDDRRDVLQRALEEHHADEEGGHDDGADGGGRIGVDALQADLAEDGDKRRRGGGQQGEHEPEMVQRYHSPVFC